MSVWSDGIAVILVAYLLVIAVAGAVLYLGLRFGIRDGLRGHRLWLERTGRLHPAGDTDEEIL